MPLSCIWHISRLLVPSTPGKFAQFIGKEMRLAKVEYAPRAESTPILNF
jgi:hypothetical protein